MAPRGTAARMAAPDLPQPVETCPRCCSPAMALCRLVVCSRYGCDWERPRFGPRLQELPQIAPNPMEGTRCSDALARRALEHIRQYPWSTAVEVATALERSAELARTILLRARCQRRKRAAKGAPYEYALPDVTAELVEEPIAC